MSWGSGGAWVQHPPTDIKLVDFSKVKEILEPQVLPCICGCFYTLWQYRDHRMMILDLFLFKDGDGLRKPSVKDPSVLDMDKRLRDELETHQYLSGETVYRHGVEVSGSAFTAEGQG